MPRSNSAILRKACENRVAARPVPLHGYARLVEAPVGAETEWSPDLLSEEAKSILTCPTSSPLFVLVLRFAQDIDGRQHFFGKPMGAKKVSTATAALKGQSAGLLWPKHAFFVGGASCESQGFLADQPQIATPSSSSPLLLRKSLHTHTHTYKSKEALISSRR